MRNWWSMEKNRGRSRRINSDFSSIQSCVCSKLFVVLLYVSDNVGSYELHNIIMINSTVVKKDL